MELELRGITKRFPGVVANDNVNLTIRSGEVLALVGENGAGKSTLMNILYGLYHADEGDIYIDGTPVKFETSGDAIAAGIGMVHQHFMLVPVFTVAENVVLGIEPTRGLSLDRAKAAAEVERISDEYSLGLEPDALIENLPVGIQQRVEISKVLLRDAEIVVFDEPTAVLTPQEIDDFFRIVEALKASGRGIVFITHKLTEALRVADRISVLRRGQTVGEADPSEIDEVGLAELMVGRPVQLVVDKSPAEPGASTLQVNDLHVVDASGRTLVDHTTFDVRAGEIVGIAGVQGNGQTELVEAITGLREILSGTVSVDGIDLTDASPRDVHLAAVAHVPEDRQRSGLVSEFSVAENLVLTRYHSDEFSSGVTMNWSRVRENARELVEQYDVRTPSIDTSAGTLSGGNQQKVIVARELSRDLRLVIASQPTRGVDVGSIEYIHAQVVAARDEGAAVMVVSTELDEVMALADRVIVLYRGRVVADLDRDATNHNEVGLYMAGALDQNEQASA
ncbi:ABC transporter ATP-binding protein [Ilumatobacter nonamiensis]|uniref:ABC transporter ATP-binding protein n=1 Tax=Ilumatobacter nonamiensis TaxID=467093 RepID=UPI0003497336|nr:ABC transporter ATP-binding protein [Ilumatobacter nonamiensis]